MKTMRIMKFNQVMEGVMFVIGGIGVLVNTIMSSVGSSPLGQSYSLVRSVILVLLACILVEVGAWVIRQGSVIRLHKILQNRSSSPVENFVRGHDVVGQWIIALCIPIIVLLILAGGYFWFTDLYDGLNADWSLTRESWIIGGVVLAYVVVAVVRKKFPIKIQIGSSSGGPLFHTYADRIEVDLDKKEGNIVLFFNELDDVRSLTYMEYSTYRGSGADPHNIIYTDSLISDTKKIWTGKGRPKKLKMLVSPTGNVLVLRGKEIYYTLGSSAEEADAAEEAFNTFKQQNA